jgi:hypothetical protein
MNLIIVSIINVPSFQGNAKNARQAYKSVAYPLMLKTKIFYNILTKITHD